MKRRNIIITLAILFAAVNSLLVYLDKEDRVPRLSYVEEWSQTFEEDLYVELETPGVLTALTQKNVYFDEDRGSFGEFLVNSNDKVDVGDGLFTYKAHDYYETKSYLENEVSKLNSQVAAIEQAITDISLYSIPEAEVTTELESEDSTLVIANESAEADYRKEQYLAEKNKELALKEAELQSLQTQLSELETSGDIITVESPYEGIVTEVSESLNDPLLTIRDTELKAEGELTESERMKVQQEMPVEVIVREDGSVLDGTVQEVSQSPEDVTVEGTSTYPLQVGLAEGSDIEGLLPGYHTTMAITLKKAVGATAVMDDEVYNKRIWEMTPEGKLDKQKIETGIHVNGMYEITKGAESGQWIAAEENSQFRDGAPFITPVQLDNIQWKHLGNYDNVSWKKYFVTGLLSR
ncbi:efflux RND transporter periplasmic adaptor subunit [Virgibacillus kekensis]|uniref:Efflux RND transporter periplasmic adaptor subunit n=1 Tax=Virgibacillus kekensis TaxID=202261 RepID=A0ABV9DPY3_9BACI